MPRLFTLASLSSLVALVAHARPTCPDGLVPNQKGQRVAPPSCPPGKMLVLDKCFDACPKGSAHDSHARCTVCTDGYTKHPKTGACVAPPTCPPGKVLVLDKCFDACPKGSAHDSHAKCTVCTDGYTKHPKTGACVPMSK
jgi:hypothetical protein